MSPESPTGGPTPPTRSAELDFDAAFREAEGRPLPFPDGAFAEIEARCAFTSLTEGWAEWLLELRRLLSEDGRLLIGLSGRESFEQLAGRPWDESLVGMTVLSPLDGPGRRLVFHSEWWIRAHWGRAFEVVSIEESDGRTAVLRKRPGDVTADDLERPDPGDQREQAAARANSSFLADQIDRATRHHQSELEEQREDMNRELMRRSFAAADAEWSRRGPGSPATLVAAEYEATTSWRLTKPLRALGRLLRRDR
jgi:SAM-dependent methyltransferase